MALTLASLLVKIGADVSGAEAGFKKVNDAVTDANGRLRDAHGRFVNVGGAMDKAGASASALANPLAAVQSRITGLAAGFVGLGLATVAFAGLKATVIDFNGQMEQSRIAWTTMLKSADAANVVLKDLQSFAARTPFEFGPLEQYSRRLVAMGFAAKDIIPIMTDVGNASAALGGGNEGISRIITALGQMRAKGKVSAEEMNQLAEMAVPAWQMLADATGKPIPVLMDLAQQGQITADTMIQAFRRYSQENWGGMMDQQSRTFLGVLSTIKDNVTQTIAGAFAPLFNRISSLALKIGEFTSQSQFATWAGQVAGAVNGVITLLSQIPAPLMQGILAFGALAAAVATFSGVAMVVGPVVAALTGPIGLVIAAVAGLYVAWTNNFLGIQDTVNAILPGVADFVVGLIAGLVTWWNETIPKLAEIVGIVLAWIQQAWSDYGGQIVNIAVVLWSGIADLIGKAMQIISDIVATVLAIIKGDWQGALVGLGRIISTAWTGIVNALAASAKAVVGIMRVVFQVFGDTTTIGNLEGQIDSLATKFSDFSTPVAYAAEVEERSAGLVDAHSAALQRNRAQVEGVAKSIMSQLVPAKKSDAQALFASERAYNNAQAALDRQKAAADGGAGAVANAGKKAKEAGISVADLTKALVAQHPATLAAASAVTYWEQAIANTNLAIEANKDQLKAAQDELQGMQDRLSSLNAELSTAKQRFDDLSSPRLTGMGQAEDQFFAVEQQLKRLQYAASTGSSLDDVKAMFPALTAGQEEFLATLPTTEDGLQKMQEQLRLAQSLQFDGQLRQIEQAAKGAQMELGFTDAMSQMLAAKQRVTDLTGAVQAQEAAIRSQEGVVRSIQAAGDALARTQEWNNQQAAIAKQNFDLVTQSLQAAFTWILTDRQEIEKMGPAGIAAALQVDAKTIELLKGLSKFAEENTSTNQMQVKAMNDAYTTAVDDIKKNLATIPRDFDVTVHVKTVQEGGGEMPGRASGGRVEKGRAYLVGEEGPEPFIPDQSGTILPNSSLRAPVTASAAGGATVVENHYHIGGSVIAERQLLDLVNTNQRTWQRDNGRRL